MQNNHAGNPPLRILPIGQTANRVGLSERVIYEKVADRTFPAPVQLSPRRVGWVESEVEAWIAARIAQRDEAA